MPLVRLSTRDHDRGAAGLKYVYPVISRRARGVSIGVNLNPNQACNWRCVYCQVPGLVRGAGPPIDLRLLESELTGLLDPILHGDWMSTHVPPESRRLSDIAFSGDGEPTTSMHFCEAVDVVGRVLKQFDRIGTLPLVLITNGSLIHRIEVRRGLERLSALGGTVWFKLDGGTAEARRRINDTSLTDERLDENLALCAQLCPTRIQTMVLAFDGQPPSEWDQRSYLATLQRALEAHVPIQDVLLYGLEREAHQPEAARLSPLSPEWMHGFAHRIQELGLDVKVHP